MQRCPGWRRNSDDSNRRGVLLLLLRDVGADAHDLAAELGLRAGGQTTLEGMSEPLVLDRTATQRLRETLAGEKG